MTTPLRTDTQLEEHIAECGRRMEQAYAVWEREGCFAARGDAGRWRLEMERAIAQREGSKRA